MTRLTSDDVRSFLLAFFADGTVSGRPLLLDRFPDDFDVMADGGLDSLGYLELLSRLESEFDRELDFGDSDDVDLTRVDTLIRATAAVAD